MPQPLRTFFELARQLFERTDVVAVGQSSREHTALLRLRVQTIRLDHGRNKSRSEQAPLLGERRNGG